MEAPFFFHWQYSGPEPTAVTENFAGCPTTTCWLDGCATMEGTLEAERSVLVDAAQPAMDRAKTVRNPRVTGHIRNLDRLDLQSLGPDRFWFAGVWCIFEQFTNAVLTVQLLTWPDSGQVLGTDQWTS